MKKYLVIGDIHGQYILLKSLIEKANLNSEDEIISLGDVINRGPKSRSCLEYLLSLNATILMGNHEYNAIKYRKWLNEQAFEYIIDDNPEKYNDKLIKNLLLEKAPANLNKERILTHLSINDNLMNKIKLFSYYKKLTFDEKTYLLVHAGFDPFSELENQKQHIMINIRYVDPITTKLLKHKINNISAEHWTCFWKKPYNVIYGHFVHSLNKPYITKFNVDNREYKTFGIDTGATFGGKLTGLLLPEERIIQVD